MLQPILHHLKGQRIVLASGSPRRQEIIQRLGLENIELCPSTFEENLKPDDFPSYGVFVEETAYQKVFEVDQRLKKSGKEADLIIGADTMVTIGRKIFGKPKTNEVAFQMLSELIDKKHTVYTGVTIKYHDKVRRFTESTDVYFGKASKAQIQAYIDTGEPLDKAGAYGIQGDGGTFIRRIEGDYFTVVGLPLYRLCAELCHLFDYELST